MKVTAEALKQFCLNKKGAFEDFPFGDDPVYKVDGKMFALVVEQDPPRIVLKCDPRLVPILRETYPAVKPPAYFDKNHWNQIVVDGSIPEDELWEMIDQSYALVVKGLTKAARERLTASG
jgi:predicted DNA-binding protein (MmcQ/YjbR family)